MDFREPQRIGELLRDLPCPWYVCGGWALDLFVGRVTRVHKDVDVAIARTDQTAVQSYLRERGWRLETVHGGQREPWDDGERLALPVHGVWCWNEHHRPAFFELLLNEIDAEQLRFRRDPSVVLPRARVAVRTSAGVPILAPEIVLLYKSASPGESEGDFRNTVGGLTEARRRWLRAALEKVYGAHPWVEHL